MWISCKERMPKEDEFDWVCVKKGDKEYNHPCKVWENHDGETSFVNIMFEKEKQVTHWKEWVNEQKAEE